MMRPLLHVLAVFCAVACMAGCVAGPDYARPELELPAHWASPLDGGTQPGTPGVADWWEELGDPVLAELVGRATEANHDVRLARARLREARANRTFVASVLRPGVRGNASAIRSEESVEGFGANPSNSRFVLGHDASWEIDLFGDLQRQIEAADAELGAMVESERDVRVSLAAEVALNYVELRTAQQRLDITRRNIAAQEDTVALTAARYAAGLSSELDAVRARALLASFQAQVPQLEQERAGAIHRLGVLLGGAPGSLAEQLAPHAPLPELPDAVMVRIPSELLQRRPDIRAAERRMAAAHARIGVAHAALFPKFRLTASVTNDATALRRLLDTGTRGWSVGPRIEWPFFQHHRLHANIEVQDARYEQALIEYEQTVLLALEETENALVSYAKEQDERDAIARAVEANTRAVALANERYTRGLEGFLNVLQAQRELFDSEDQLVQSRRFALTNLIALYKALGGGWSLDELPAPGADEATPMSAAAGP